ncbi:tubulin-specific chaperone C [Marchantia polymorpha subsp. ruderalis]
MATENAEVQAAAAEMLERKHAERLERLALINKNRLEGSSIRKSQAADSSDPRESVDVFLAAFGQKREVVEKGLASALANEVEPTHIKRHLDDLALEVGALEKLVADASYFLPAYDVRSSQTTILKLKDDLESASSQLLPKKKFSFRNKAAKKVPAPSIEEKPTTLETGQVKPNGLQDTPQPVPADSPAASLPEINNRERIQGKENMVFVRDADVLGAELTLSNLNKCKVYLRGRLTTLYIDSLRNCQIFVGPVTGSVFIENVENSTLVLASHQIRIHSTKSTDFYVRVRSRPIVEYTTKNRFAPYAFSYLGIEEDLRAANLAEETGLWEKVDDFRWLRAVPSPNWTSVPLKERIHVEDGSIVTGVGCDE